MELVQIGFLRPFLPRLLGGVRMDCLYLDLLALWELPVESRQHVTDGLGDVAS